MSRRLVLCLITALISLVLHGCQFSQVPLTADHVSTVPVQTQTPVLDSGTPNTPDLSPVETLNPSPTTSFSSQSSYEIDEPINLIFAGDVMFDWSVKEAIAKQGPDFPFIHVKQQIEKADYAFVNLETAVTLESDKDTNQIYNFKSNPESLIGLKNAGFDMVSVANNHTMDFLRKGFLDTLENLDKADLLYVGGGMNAKEAYSAKK